ncbi:MAG: methylated-DNA--[protein]-cysteine S-methyltransferase [Gammaproteobacteria bacterium]
MTDNKRSDYERVATAIEYISEHVKDQPSLDQIAEQINLSPQHFQRLFSRWAGVSPKRFLQALTVEHAKKRLEDSTLLEKTHDLGLSSTARLHDHFVTLEAMTPGEFKSKGQGLQINYGVHDSQFGEVFLATTQRGICHLIFPDQKQRQADIDQALVEIKQKFIFSDLVQDQKTTKEMVEKIFSTQREKLSLITVGTNFQINVWKALLKIPSGQLSTYGAIAKQLENPKASRAVGSAVGANPISYIIPCHRVIASTGIIGHYRWGKTRKKAMLVWES